MEFLQHRSEIAAGLDTIEKAEAVFTDYPGAFWNTRDLLGISGRDEFSPQDLLKIIQTSIDGNMRYVEGIGLARVSPLANESLPKRNEDLSISIEPGLVRSFIDSLYRAHLEIQLLLEEQPSLKEKFEELNGKGKYDPLQLLVHLVKSCPDFSLSEFQKKFPAMSRNSIREEEDEAALQSIIDESDDRHETKRILQLCREETEDGSDGATLVVYDRYVEIMRAGENDPRIQRRVMELILADLTWTQIHFQLFIDRKTASDPEFLGPIAAIALKRVSSWPELEIRMLHVMDELEFAKKIKTMLTLRPDLQVVYTEFYNRLEKNKERTDLFEEVLNELVAFDMNRMMNGIQESDRACHFDYNFEDWEVLYRMHVTKEGTSCVVGADLTGKEQELADLTYLDFLEVATEADIPQKQQMQELLALLNQEGDVIRWMSAQRVPADYVHKSISHFEQLLVQEYRAYKELCELLEVQSGLKAIYRNLFLHDKEHRIRYTDRLAMLKSQFE